MTSVAAPGTSAREQVATVVVTCFKKLFSEARIIARNKLAAYASFVFLVGLGFTLKVTGIGIDSTPAAVAEFTLATPDLLQIVGGLVGLMWVGWLNVYTFLKRKEWTLELLKLAAAKDTHPDVRRHIMEKELAT